MCTKVERSNLNHIVDATKQISFITTEMEIKKKIPIKGHIFFNSIGGKK